MKDRPALKIVYRDPRKLKANPNNAREHPRDQLEQIKESFRKFGFTNPVALKEDEATIGAGHGRIEAACEMLTAGERLPTPDGVSVPTITLVGLSEAEWRAFVIADNRIAENSSWNDDVLRLELKALTGMGFDLEGIGFDAPFVTDLFAPPATKGRASPDKVPLPPRVPVSRPGDLWSLGAHLLLCGDSTDPECVARVIAGAKIGLTLTDPPYGIGFGYGQHDDRGNAANAELVAKVFAAAPPCARVWTPGPMNLARDIARFGKTKIAYWHKVFTTALNGMGGAATVEPILILGTPKRRALPNDYIQVRYDQEELEGRSLKDHHPCPKPVSLFAHLAEAFLPNGGHLFEPFCGSGTTVVAAESCGRIAHAIEIDPAYVDVAILRWQNFTGSDAVDVDGVTYAARAKALEAA